MIEILLTTLRVSLTASCIAFALAIPLTLWMVNKRESFKKNILMMGLTMANSLPPVFVGLVLYLLFSYAGFFKEMELLFTQTAMVTAQVVLSLPVIVISAYSSIKTYVAERRDFFQILHLSRFERLKIILSENISTLQVAYLVGLGRCLSEVGAVMIVGGNIRGDTRVLTSSIVLETSRGNISQAVYLGLTLLGISIILSMTILIFQKK